MIAKTIEIINIIWQGAFLIRAIQISIYFNKVEVNVFSPGYLWPVISYGSAIFYNLILLRANNNKIIWSLMGAIIPIGLGVIIGNYYTHKANEEIIKYFKKPDR